MNNKPMYRWLDQHGEAFGGAPGTEPRWTSRRKDAVCTANEESSCIWFTCSHGILNEIGRFTGPSETPGSDLM
jgi:glucoamylase